MKCSEIELNYSKITLYMFVNSIIFVPQAKAFVFIYNFFSFLFEIKKFVKNNLDFIKFLIIDFFIFFLIFIFFYNLNKNMILNFGFSYFSLYVSSALINDVFDECDRNYENFKALYQHVILNCFINYTDTVGEADELKIIFDKEEGVFFNMLSYIRNFIKNTVGGEFLINSVYSPKNDFKTYYIENHPTFIIFSKKYKDQNLSTNMTSNKLLKCINKKNENIVLTLQDGYKPNLAGQDKFNYLTPLHNIDMEHAKIKELPENFTQKASWFRRYAQTFIINSYDKKK